MRCHESILLSQQEHLNALAYTKQCSARTHSPRYLQIRTAYDYLRLLGYSRMLHTFFIAIWVLIIFSGCSQKQQTINLGELYNRSAQSHPIDRNPVILIPGIKGSQLVDKETGTIIWGTFGGKGLNPNTKLGLELFSMPMQKGIPLNELSDSIVADGVLGRVEIGLAGLSFDLKAYYNILGILGVGQYLDYNIAMEKGIIEYGEDHYTCFQFAYDWRLSLDENVRLLNDFIKEKQIFVQQQIEEIYGIKEYAVQFDLIAHSMGGLLSRYFLRYGNQTCALRSSSITLHSLQKTILG